MTKLPVSIACFAALALGATGVAQAHENLPEGEGAKVAAAAAVGGPLVAAGSVEAAGDLKADQQMRSAFMN